MKQSKRRSPRREIRPAPRRPKPRKKKTPGRLRRPRAAPPAVPAIVSSKPRAGVKFADLDEKHRQVFATPAGFGRLYLKIPLTDRQCEVVNAMGPTRSAISVKCCNEAGKTTKMLPTLILWHCAVFPRRGENGGCITTSGSWAQITNQLVPALKGFQSRFPKWSFQDRNILRDGVPNWMAFSTREPGRAEGFHGSPGNPLMALIDEAKTVRGDIFRVIEDRCRPQRLGLFSSPGYATGNFYDSQTSAAGAYRKFEFTVNDCPWIDRKEMERLIRKAGGGDYERGLQDPLIQSAYWARFMKFVEGGLISDVEIQEALAGQPGFKSSGGRHGWCDFAAGGDENVFALRVGNRVRIIDAWRDRNTMSAVGRFVVNFQKMRKECGLKPEEIEGDADGLGRPMLDAIHQAGWPILPFGNNSPAFDPTRFKNRISEVWFNGTEQIKKGQVILPDDGELHGQLVDRVARFESSGKRWLESKRDLFARQGRDGRPQRSPDRADAVLGSLAELPIAGTVSLLGPREKTIDDFGPYVGEPVGGGEMEVPEELLGGFDAGG